MTWTDPNTDDPTVFVVPVHLQINGVEHKVLLGGPDMRVALPGADSTVVVNAGGHGYYRVAYDSTLRSRLLERPALPSEGRRPLSRRL